MNDKATQFVTDSGLTMHAVFVPFSMSRNRGDLQRCLNWTIRIDAPNGRSLVTDYMQGAGHIPGRPCSFPRLSVDGEAAEKKTCETGLNYFTSQAAPMPLATPSLVDVLYSLVMDAGAVDAGSFEEWAADLGYEADEFSEGPADDEGSAEAMYRACMETAANLQAMGINLDDAREAFADY